MPVAKTYEKMAQQGEPFKENGRMYVNILAPKGVKKVRWYTEVEYKRMYPGTVVEHTSSTFNARHAFGFDEKGYILLYKGRNVEEWAENNRTNIWFNLIFGYYTPSKFECPKLADGIESVVLNWDDVAANDISVKSDDEVKKIVAAMLNDENGSNFQGNVNDWLQKSVVVKDKKSKESHFGTKHTYTLEDNEGNVYMWETGAKDYSIEQEVSLKMKVKDHKEINNTKTTIVWYCKEC